MGYVGREALNHAAWSGLEAGYGIDLAKDHVIVMRHGKRGSEPGQRVYAGNPADDEKAWRTVSDRIAEEMRRGRAWLACGLPVHAAIVRRIDVPLSSVGKARRVLPSQLDLQLPFPIEACQYEFLDLATSTPGQVEALALAVRSDELQQCVEGAKKIGLDPVLVDHEGLALWTQVLEEGPRVTGTRVIAYLGRDHTSLLFGRDQRFLAAHGIRGALPAAGDPGDFCNRLQRILRAQPLEDTATLPWTWCGPGAEAREQVAALETQLGTDRPILFDTVARPGDFLAAAYARRARSLDSYPCNFRAGETAHPVFEANRAKRNRRTALTLLAAGLLLTACGLAWMERLRYRVNDLQQQLSQQAQSITGSPVPRGQERLLVSRFMEEAADREAPFAEMFAATRRHQLHDLLQFVRLNRFTLNHLGLTADRVELMGTAYDWDACEILPPYFETRGYRATLERKDADASQRVPFSLIAEKNGTP